MPLPKLQFAFSWSAYFSNRTESYPSQIEFPGPHGIICNFTFSYLILSKKHWQEETSYLIFGRSRPWSARIYTYKRVVCVCLSVCLSVCFLSATRHLSTLRRCLRVAERVGAVAGSPARARAGKHAQRREHACTCRTTSQRKIAALMPFKNKTVRARACCRIRNCRDFQKREKRKPTCHFPSSVYSLPSLGVFTFRIVLNRT